MIDYYLLIIIVFLVLTSVLLALSRRRRCKHVWTSWTIYMEAGTGSNVNEYVRYCRKCGKMQGGIEKRKDNTWK